MRLALFFSAFSDLHPLQMVMVEIESHPRFSPFSPISSLSPEPMAALAHTPATGTIG